MIVIFLDGLVTKVYEFGHQKVTEHLEDIYGFLAKKKNGEPASIREQSQAKIKTSLNIPVNRMYPDEMFIIKQKNADKKSALM